MPAAAPEPSVARGATAPGVPASPHGAGQHHGRLHPARPLLHHQGLGHRGEADDLLEGPKSAASGVAGGLVSHCSKGDWGGGCVLWDLYFSTRALPTMER